MCVLDLGCALAFKDGGVHVVRFAPVKVQVDARGKDFRPGAAMHLPLVIVGRFLRQQRRLGQQAQDVLATQRDVAELASRASIGICSRQHGVPAHAHDDQRRVHERLEAEIAMHVFAELAIAGDVPRRWSRI